MNTTVPKSPTRRYKVAFKIGGRLGRFSFYSLREICAFLVDKWSFTDREINAVVDMEVSSVFEIADLKIVRVR